MLAPLNNLQKQYSSHTDSRLEAELVTFISTTGRPTLQIPLKFQNQI
jgi:hypothetical protein